MTLKCRRCGSPASVKAKVPDEIGICWLCPHCHEYLVLEVKDFLEEWKRD